MYSAEITILQGNLSKPSNNCVDFCCRYIRHFHTIAGQGFKDLAQVLINVRASNGHPAVESVFPDYEDIMATKRQKLVRETSVITSSNPTPTQTQVTYVREL